MESTLRESAPLALQWSQQHCRVDAELKRDCGWYHGFWQIARVMGIGKASGGHADFLLDALREHARTGEFRRVLVSGTVDYSMPALVYQAYAMEDASVDLTVVDWCETPLLLSQWYADRVEQPVRTVRSNILDMRESAGFDLVLTNSFLGYFTVEQRQRLFGVWADLLRPGGKAVLSNRVRPEFEAGRVGFRSDEARRFCEEVDARAEATALELGVDAARIRSGAREYVRNFSVYPVTSHEALHRAMKDGGFGTIDADLASSQAGATAVSGPSTTEQGIYARIVATRRG